MVYAIVGWLPPVPTAEALQRLRSNSGLLCLPPLDPGSLCRYSSRTALLRSSGGRSRPTT